MCEIPLCAGALRQNGQASAAHDEAIRGTGEEEGHGGRGLQDRPEAPQSEIQRCGKENLQGTENICHWQIIILTNIVQETYLTLKYSILLIPQLYVIVSGYSKYWA